MAYTFFKSEKRKDKETLYVAYMMIGSFFKKTLVSNRNAEMQLYLHYKEMNIPTQQKLESDIVKKAEKELRQYLPCLSEMQADVTFKLDDSDSRVIFDTGFEEIRVEVSRNGAYQIELAQ